MGMLALRLVNFMCPEELITRVRKLNLDEEFAVKSSRVILPVRTAAFAAIDNMTERNKITIGNLQLPTIESPPFFHHNQTHNKIYDLRRSII